LKASELCQHLKELIDRHGDQDIEIKMHEYGLTTNQEVINYIYFDFNEKKDIFEAKIELFSIFQRYN
jgi:hypothetical protein